MADHKWTQADNAEYARLMKKIDSGEELSQEEKAAFKDLFWRKAQLIATEPGSRLNCKLLEQSITLVDDLEADGAKFSQSEKAEMTVLLYGAGDNMVKRFALIKKAARLTTPKCK